MREHPIREGCRITLVLVLTTVLSGCVSVKTTYTKGANPAATEGSLEVAVYDTPQMAKAGVPTSGSVSLGLGRLEKDRPEASVQSFSGATWSLDSLNPGEYRLHLNAAPPGATTGSAPKITKEDIRIAAGEIARTQIILKKFPTTTVVWVTLGAAAVFGILYAIAASSIDLGFGTERATPSRDRGAARSDLAKRSSASRAMRHRSR